MGKNKHLSLQYLPLVLCVGFFAGCTTTIRLNPHFEKRRQEIHTIGVMPCESNIVLVKFKGDNERIKDEEARVCDALTAAVRQELWLQGFALSDQQISLDTSDKFSLSEELRFKLTQLQKSTDEVFAKMYNKPAYSEACTFSLGPQINPFADELKADALVFVRMIGFRKSGGQQSADLGKSCLLALTGSVVIYYPENGSVFVMVADGNNGDILWANTATGTGSISDAAVHDMVRAVFKGFPKVKK